MAAMPTEQVPGLYHRKIGDIVVTSVSDGHVNASFEMVKDITPLEAERILRDSFRPSPPRISVNCFIIRSAGRIALVDTGCGTTMGDQLGRLQKHLAIAGIGVQDIDTILLTHMHPDHSNGLTGSAGEAHFPVAELVVSETDVRHWHDDSAMSIASQRHRERFFMGAREQIKPYMNRRRDAVGEVFPGVTALPLPGHTPGHTGYVVNSGNDSLLIWGDIVHVPDIQVHRPDVHVEPDSNHQLAIITRRRTFDMVAKDRLLVAGMHMHFPGLLNLTGDAQHGYALVPETWQHTL